MTEKHKAFVAEMRSNANRTGNKKLEEFLREGANTVQLILLQNDKLNDEIAALKNANNDLRERESAWRMLVDGYKQTLFNASKQETTPEPDTSKTQKEADSNMCAKTRFNYMQFLQDFSESDKTSTFVKCELKYELTGRKDADYYGLYYPSFAQMKHNASKRFDDLYTLWDKKTHCIRVFKS